MLKADFHSHVKIFGQKPFRPEQLPRRLEWARRIGLDMLAVTEHMDLPDFWHICHHLELICEGASGIYRHGKITVLTGAEISILEGGDILLIGPLESLRELEKRLGRITAENLPVLEDLLDASEELGFLRIGAHPCRRHKVLWKMMPLLKRLDALEINAGELKRAAYVQQQARTLGLPVVAGSDAHHWLQLGTVFNLLSLKQDFTMACIKEAVVRGRATWQRSGAWSSLYRGLTGARQ